MIVTHTYANGRQVMFGDLPLEKIVRTEADTTDDLGRKYKIILLDAEDTFDVIVESPNGERECVWSHVKPPEGL